MKKTFGKLFAFLFKLLPWMVLGVSVVGLFFGPSEYEQQAYFRQNGVEVTAEVTDVKRLEKLDTDGYTEVEYKVYVSYAYEGEDYSDVFLQSQSGRPRVGSERTILVDPADPGNIHTTSLDGGVMVIVVMGILFVVCWTILSIALANSRVRRKWPVSGFYQNAVLRLADVQRELTQKSEKTHTVALGIMALGAGPMAIAGVWALAKYGQTVALEKYGLLYLVSMAAGLAVIWWLRKRNTQKCAGLQLKRDTVRRWYIKREDDGSLCNTVEFGAGGHWRAIESLLLSRSGKTGADFLPGTNVILAMDAKNRILRVFYAPEYMLAE